MAPRAVLVERDNRADVLLPRDDQMHALILCHALIFFELVEKTNESADKQTPSTEQINTLNK